MPKLGVIGDISEDIIVFQSLPLEHGTDTPSRIVRTRGGSAANLAAVAATLLPTRFIGCVGSDRSGRFVVETLQSEGVEVCVTTGTRSCSIIVLISPDGERTMLPDRAANAELSKVPNAWLDDLSALHITTYSLEGGTTTDSCFTALAQVAANGGLTSLDTSSTAILRLIGEERFAQLVVQLDPDIVFANELEAAMLGWDIAAPAERLLVIKHGGDPVLFRSTAGAVRVPVAPVTGVVDFTGAGDAYAAGFLFEALTDLTKTGESARTVRNIAPNDPRLVRWCAFAHQKAATVITRPGAGAMLG
ncbi:MAG: PfkB family carbohydrate kinase [Propionibacteriaceae bacterium]|jgi:sugar/nucleoside kinase (ribokinase family)|nr:PfkB family carbohydrate kinase [Propionibacteriaceae bacterium]